MKALFLKRNLFSRACIPYLRQRRNRSESTKPASAIPGPKPWPILGTIPLHRPGGELYHVHNPQVGFYMYNKYGPIVREMMLPGRPLTHIFHPEDIEKVLRNDGEYPWRLPIDVVVHYREKKGVSIGLPFLQGEEWFRVRNHVQKPMLRPRTVASYLQEQAVVTDDLVTRVRKLRDSYNDMHDFIGELNLWAMEAIGVVCFNTRIGALQPDLTVTVEAQKFIAAVKGTLEYIDKKAFAFPAYRFFHTRSYRRFTKDMDTIWNSAGKYITRIQEMAQRGELGERARKDNLLLNLISQNTLSHDETSVVIADLLGAGVDTTANLLAFCLYHIATNPHAQEMLQEEIDEKLPRGVPLTEKAFDQMSYLKSVVKETARMTPVTNALSRNLSKEITLQGYTIPAGETVLMWLGVTGMLPHHFDDPEKFLPERWLRSSVTRDINPFSVLPFGFGPRMCIGRRFAEQEVYLGIAKLLQNFSLEQHDGVLKIKSCLTNTPATPFKIRFNDRQ